MTNDTEDTTREQAPADITVDARGRPVVPGHTFQADLGAGGMGAVYLYKDNVLGRLTAVKVINPAILSDSGARQRFAREARLLAKLDHENITRIFFFFEGTVAAGGASLTCFLMEYVEGTTLETLIKPPRRLEPPHAIGLIAQAAAGLEAACDAGLIHRDIKPANLLVDKDGRLRVADLGLARPVSKATGVDNVTGGQMVVGTRGYMSPEQAKAEELDHRSDIYSLGVVFFEALHGGKFAPGKVREALMHRQPPVSEDLTELIAAMVAESPDARPPSYTELRRRLLALPEYSSTSAATAAVLPSFPTNESSTEEEVSLAKKLFGVIGSAARWWEADQILSIVLMVPIWTYVAYLLDAWDAFGTGTVALIAVCICQTIVTVLRLYLLLVAATVGEERISQIDRCMPWIRRTDYVLMAVVFGSALLLIQNHRIGAILLIALSLAGAMKFALLDPFLLGKAKDVWRNRTGKPHSRPSA